MKQFTFTILLVISCFFTYGQNGNCESPEILSAQISGDSLYVTISSVPSALNYEYTYAQDGVGSETILSSDTTATFYYIVTDSTQYVHVKSICDSITVNGRIVVNESCETTVFFNTGPIATVDDVEGYEGTNYEDYFDILDAFVDNYSPESSPNLVSKVETDSEWENFSTPEDGNGVYTVLSSDFIYLYNYFLENRFFFLEDESLYNETFGRDGLFWYKLKAFNIGERLGIPQNCYEPICNVNATFSISNSSLQYGDSFEIEVGGAEYGYFIVDDLSDYSWIDLNSLSGQGNGWYINTSGNLVLEQTVDLLPGYHSVCFVAVDVDSLCADTVCHTILVEDCGSALEYSGLNEQTKITHNGDFNFGNQEFSMELFIQTSTTKNNVIVLTNNVTNNIFALKGIFIGLENGKLYANIVSSVFSNRLLVDNDGQDLRDGQCHHIAVTRSGDNNLNLFVDGVNVESGSIASTYSMSYGANFYLGQTHLGGTAMDYDGIIDELRVWSIERNDSDLLNNMHNVLTGSETSLEGYWRFNEGSGQVSQDLTSYNHDAVLGSNTSVNGNDPEWVNYCCNNMFASKQNIVLDEIKTSEATDWLKMSIFPNPFSDVFTLNIEINKVAELEGFIQVFNVSGQIIFEKEITTNNVDVDFSDYPSGVYLIQFVSPQGSIMQKLVKS